MSDDRVIIRLPSDIIRLHGAIQNTLSNINCATSNLTYKSYISIDSTFLFVSQLVFGNALKSITADSSLYFEGDIAGLYVKKNMENISEEMVLTALFIMCVEKTMELHSDFSISTDVTVSTEKQFQTVLEDMLLSVENALSAAKKIRIEEAFGWHSAITNPLLDKDFGNLDSTIALATAVRLIAEKSAGVFISNFGLFMSVKFMAGRLRKLLDIDDLKLSEIDHWNMDTFDVIVS